MRDPMGFLLSAARVDAVLMVAARQVESELDALRKRVVLAENDAEQLSRVIEERYDCECTDWQADYVDGEHRCAAHAAHAANVAARPMIGHDLLT